MMMVGTDCGSEDQFRDDVADDSLPSHPPIFQWWTTSRQVQSALYVRCSLLACWNLGIERKKREKLMFYS